MPNEIVVLEKNVLPPPPPSAFSESSTSSSRHHRRHNRHAKSRDTSEVGLSLGSSGSSGATPPPNAGSHWTQILRFPPSNVSSPQSSKKLQPIVNHSTHNHNTNTSANNSVISNANFNNSLSMLSGVAGSTAFFTPPTPPPPYAPLNLTPISSPRNRSGKLGSLKHLQLQSSTSSNHTISHDSNKNYSRQTPPIMHSRHGHSSPLLEKRSGSPSALVSCEISPLGSTENVNYHKGRDVPPILSMFQAFDELSDGDDGNLDEEHHFASSAAHHKREDNPFNKELPIRSYHRKNSSGYSSNAPPTRNASSTLPQLGCGVEDGHSVYAKPSPPLHHSNPLSGEGLTGGRVPPPPLLLEDESSTGTGVETCSLSSPQFNKFSVPVVTEGDKLSRPLRTKGSDGAINVNSSMSGGSSGGVTTSSYHVFNKMTNVSVEDMKDLNSVRQSQTKRSRGETAGGGGGSGGGGNWNAVSGFPSLPKALPIGTHNNMPALHGPLHTASPSPASSMTSQPLPPSILITTPVVSRVGVLGGGGGNGGRAIQGQDSSGVSEVSPLVDVTPFPSFTDSGRHISPRPNEVAQRTLQQHRSHFLSRNSSTHKPPAMNPLDAEAETSLPSIMLRSNTSISHSHTHVGHSQHHSRRVSVVSISSPITAPPTPPSPLFTVLI